MLLVAALCASLPASGIARPTPVDSTRSPDRTSTVRPSDVAHEVLPDGMVVLVERDRGAPVVAMRAVWPGGIRLETARDNGITALIGRVITRGCGARSGDQLARAAARLGGELAGVAGRHSFGLRAEWTARTWRDGLDLVADCVLAPRFDGGEVARARRRMLDELDSHQGDPGQAAFRLFAQTLYRRHPYRMDLQGSPATVADLGEAELAQAYRERFPTSALTLAIVGDVDPAEVVARLRARFASRPRTASRRAPRPPAEQFAGRPGRAREAYRYLGRDEAHLVLGFPGATFASDDRHALEVLAQVLGGTSGRLRAALRERRRLADRVSAHSVEGLDPGYLAIDVSCRPGTLDAAIAAIKGEIERLVVDGATAPEVARAQRYLVEAHDAALERPSAVASALALHEAYGLGWAAWLRYPDAIRAVTPADVARVAQRYLRWDLAVTATVRPPAMTPGVEHRARGKVPRGHPKVPGRSTPARRRTS